MLNNANELKDAKTKIQEANDQIAKVENFSVYGYVKKKLLNQTSKKFEEKINNIEKLLKKFQKTYENDAEWNEKVDNIEKEHKKKLALIKSAAETKLNKEREIDAKFENDVKDLQQANTEEEKTAAEKKLMSNLSNKVVKELKKRGTRFSAAQGIQTMVTKVQSLELPESFTNKFNTLKNAYKTYFNNIKKMGEILLPKMKQELCQKIFDFLADIVGANIIKYLLKLKQIYDIFKLGYRVWEEVEIGERLSKLGELIAAIIRFTKSSENTLSQELCSAITRNRKRSSKFRRLSDKKNVI